MTRPASVSRFVVPFFLWPFLNLLTVGCGDQDAERAGPSSVSEAAQPLFTRLPASSTGVRFANLLPETPARNGLSYEYYYNGGGVAVGDLNNDGLPDLYFIGNMGPNRLYLNRGDLTFQDVTETAGVAGPMGGWATGVTMADINADGRLDIYVSQAGPFEDEDLRRNVLFINQTETDGIPRFTEESAAYGLDDPAYSTQAAFFDSDRDGDLDLYLMNHGIPAYRSLVELQTGRSPSEIDKLYRNDGGRFVDVTSQAGIIDSNMGFGLGVCIADLNNDRLPDIYVANDYAGRDFLYLGQPGGRYSEVLKQAVPHTPFSSMGSDFADIDEDGWLDLIVLEMDLPTHFGRKTFELGIEQERFSLLAREGLHYQYMANALFWNRGTREGGVPFFSDIAQLNQMTRTDWSWGPLFADLDNDGKVDLFIANGMAGKSVNLDFEQYMARRIEETQATEGRVTEALIFELIRNMPRRRTSNFAFRNEGNLAFADSTVSWGLGQPSYSNGAVYSDLDRDGDLDLVLNNVLEEATVYRNNARETGGRHFLSVRFRGPQENPFGIGARLRLKTGNRQQIQELQLTRGYQSSVEPVLHFGLGEESTVDTLEVFWPDGAWEALTDLPADQILTLDWSDGGPEPSPPPSRRQPLFVDASSALRPVPRHRSSMSILDPSLKPYPSKREQASIGIGDLNGDGLEDFVFGGGSGEPTRVYFQSENETFESMSELPGTGIAVATSALAVFDANTDGLEDIWSVSMFEAGPSAYVHRHRLFLNDGVGGFRESPTGVADRIADGATLTPGDFNADGQIDLFVGYHGIPGTTPLEGSRLFQGHAGAFTDVTQELAPDLADLGTVTDAEWADMDGNGLIDLVIAAEWEPLTLFLNEGARLRKSTFGAGIDGATGWWQSLATADFDRDGDLDLVAGNLGLNYPYHPTTDHPFLLYVGDLDGNGEQEALPAYWEDGEMYPWYGRDRLAELLPWVSELYPTLSSFAGETLPEIIGEEGLEGARRFEIRTLASSYLENLGNGRFRSRPLPLSSQVSLAAGLLPADFDGDGMLDLVLAGNMKTFDHSVPKLDAGAGLFLRGDGGGAFTPIPPDDSGLWLTGEVRAAGLLHLGLERTPAALASVAGEEALLVRPGG
jgi:hypothetical protein